MSPRTQVDTSRAAAEAAPQKRRRRPTNWVEQQKRLAWGRFWSNVNKGAMKR